MSILFVFSLVLVGVNAATLCSVGWFEKKLVVVLVVVILQDILISGLDSFQIMNTSRKLIYALFSCLGLSFVSVCILFMYILIRLGSILFVSQIIKMSST